MLGSLRAPIRSTLDVAEEKSRPCLVVASKNRPNGKEEKEVSFWDFAQ